mmetsp:Transcript_26947/g.70811  ORF Transcript_26947/g.70811 Transcript_26947/m.70811 type:complete len:536 (-) Transcript_26947:62-1669(-)
MARDDVGAFMAGAASSTAMSAANSDKKREKKKKKSKMKKGSVDGTAARAHPPSGPDAAAAGDKATKAAKSKRADGTASGASEEDRTDRAVVPAAAPAAAAAGPASDEEGEARPETFAELGLDPQLCEACDLLGWKKPTPIQAKSIPVALSGADIIGLAETGSGKTAAFALPVLHRMLKAEGKKGIFCLVLAPTRELAFQIRDTFDGLGVSVGLRTAVVVGGIDTMTQAVALQKKPHVIIATPGRIVDHLENTKGFHLKTVKFLVMDEADRILNMDFEEEVDKLLAEIPKDRTTYLFSATMTSKVQKLQRASLVQPTKIEVSSKYQTVDTLIQRYIFVPQLHKDCYVVYILNEMQGNSFMMFCSTCATTQRVTLMLRDLGFDAICLHGQMSQPKRIGALAKFTGKKNNIIVATDVASRGLDIPHVDCVINYDIPMHSKDYIHRVGRTARAGRSGRAINVVTQYDVELYQRIEKLIGKQLEQHPVNKDEVLQFFERVKEAQRTAAAELRALDESKREDGGKRRGEGGRPGKFKRKKR